MTGSFTRMIIKKITAGIVASAAVLVFGATLAHALLFAPDIEVPAPNTPPATVIHKSVTQSEYPVRLIIPSLGIDANVQNVGITAKGTMAVPNNFTDVGWYKYGAVPGTMGSAVMAGHVDNALALPGVFKHLNNIKIGDDVIVRTKEGRDMHFIVEDVESYPVEDAPADRIFNNSDGAHLNLVTCEGDWLQKEHQYNRRLVVYTHFAS